jgi:hypothetical protein
MRRILLLLVLTGSSKAIAQPANDNPCSATALTVTGSCTYATYTNAAATASAGVPAPGCALYSGQDVWFSAVVPASGNLTINTNSGTMTDSGMALYTGTCGSLTLLECDDDDSPNGAMSMITAGGLTPGSTVYIRMWDYGGGTGTFSICAVAGATTGPCGLAATNDNCPSPAILTEGPGSFAASTDVTFTADLPGNINSVFCGSIENNSWYQFTANSTTESFPITSVTGCVNNYGIQAHVYSVTYNASGCCTNFTSMSNCYNPGTTALGTVTATGLTIGNSYLLMIDGNAGDGCEFTISGWTATGILPVELISFDGNVIEQGNLLTWRTASEKNSERFDIMFSRDAEHFEKIGEVNAAGTTMLEQSYNFLHQGAPAGTNYYQLRQIDKNGQETNSSIINIKNSSAKNGLFSVAPNPFTDNLHLEILTEKQTSIEVLLITSDGILVHQFSQVVDAGDTSIDIDTKNLHQGVYHLVVKSDGNTTIQRIIK